MNVQSESREASFEDLRELLLQYRKENWAGIQTPDSQARVVSDILATDPTDLFTRIVPYFQLRPGATLLDLGSGVGSFVAACRRRGIRCFGVEPDRIGNGSRLTAVQIARRRCAESVFAAGIGEMLPFADSSFDLVTMNQVIEHVRDQEAVLREALRVLKEKGVMYVACPNYLRFYEPHYKIFFLPLFPKFLARWYLRLRGRRSGMIDQITYTTNARLRRLFATVANGHSVIDLHREQFLAKRAKGSFASRRIRTVDSITHLPLVGQTFLKVVLWFVSVMEGGCEFVILKEGSQTPH
jgi:SAM-dependent methyltransferase